MVQSNGPPTPPPAVNGAKQMTQKTQLIALAIENGDNAYAAKISNTFMLMREIQQRLRYYKGA